MKTIILQNQAFVLAGFMTTALVLLPVAQAQADSALPPLQTQGSVQFLSGGIGQTEAQAFIAAEKSYPLTLEFVEAAKPRAEYLADVHVLIRNAAGQTVLDTKAEGPFLLARLPIGHYTVEATNQGQKKIDQLEIAQGEPAKRVFEWD